MHATLSAPAAVRVIDLDEPFADICLANARDGQPYRSLVAIARLCGEPLGAATFAVGADGRVPARVLRTGLPREHNGRLGGRHRSAGRSPRSPSTPVSVVATTCRNPDALKRCLESLVACNYPALEVIVVENRPGSRATRRMLARRFGDWPELNYMEEPRAGLSRARNAGLARADGELVAFLDDDTVVDPNWVTAFVERFERGDRVDCVTGLILPLELETGSQLLFEQFAGFGKGFHARTYRLPRKLGGPAYPYTPGAIGSGANTAVRRSVAVGLGGFDPVLGAGTPAAGGEDLDLYVRLILHSRVIAYEPSAIVWHQHPDGFEKLRSQVYRYGVGLGASVAKQALRGPARRELLRAVPAGVRHATDARSRKNAAKTDAYPRHLDWLERAGMAVGPVAYVLSSATDRLPRRGEHATARNAVRHRVPVANGRSVEVAAFGGDREDPASRGPGASERVLMATARASCVLAPLALALGLPGALRLPVVLALLCIAPGMALVTALGGRTELGLVVGASLGCSALVAQSMLWLGTWWPSAFLYLMAAVSLAVLAIDRRQPNERRPRGSPIAAWFRTARVPQDARPHIAVLAVAMAAWGASLAAAELPRMAGLGLLNAMPPTYFLAFALLLAGFVMAVSRPVISPALAAMYVVALILVIHGTTPLLYDEPRYPWTFTHLGVINFIAEAGAVDRHVDIYNNWPGFFALNAWLSRVTGVSPAAYAEWAQVFFNLANVAAVRFALRGVTANERLLWIATCLFLLGNWVGQDYLAPQAFAFVLAVVIVGLTLRSQLRARAPRTRPGLWLAAAVGRLRALLPHGRLLPEPRPASPLSPRGALVVGGLCYLAVVVSHQLTPVVLIAGITALALMTRRVPLWVPVAMAAVEVGWIALAWPYVSAHYTIFDPEPTSSAAPAGYEVGKGLPGLALVAYGARVELLLFAGLALLGVVRRLRARRWDLALAVLVAAPVLIIGLNSYGGEGRYRFYLFALPWLAFFAAVACAPSWTRLRNPLRAIPLALVSAALGVCVLFAYFGQELSNHVTRADVDAAAWFERHAPRDSLLVGLTPSFPRRLSSRYAHVYVPTHPGAPALSDYPGYRHRRLGRGDIRRITKTIGAYDAPHTFLIVTPSQQRFARLFGLMHAGSARGLTRALLGSRSFQLVYASEGASVFEYGTDLRARPP
jgi:GT2 family glycosyltransferase